MNTYNKNNSDDLELASEIKMHRAVCRLNVTDKRRAASYAMLYNRMASPFILRTDRQHKAARAAKKWALKHLIDNPYVIEDSEGRFFSK